MDYRKIDNMFYAGMKHAMIHVEKMWQCPLCPYISVRKDTILRHIHERCKSPNVTDRSMETLPILMIPRAAYDAIVFEKTMDARGSAACGARGDWKTGAVEGS